MISNKKQLRLIVSQDLKPVYTDMIRVSVTALTIIIDFATTNPDRMPTGENTATLQARVVMSPATARLLKRTLEKSLKEYEKKFGKIILPKGFENR